MELLPLKTTYGPGEAVAIEIVGPAEAAATVYHLDRVVAHVGLAADRTLLELGPLPVGGYGVEVEYAHGIARTAFDVLDDPLDRPRYGFVARYERARDIGGVVGNARRLHLNAVQFYDWMYRHADLLPPSDDYVDPLGRPLSLETVRALVAGLAEAGSLSLAYAAVYAVGRDEWPSWQAAGLYRADGQPWTLGDDFLWIVDPSDGGWLEHLVDELAGALRGSRFGGFHLDQYGDPKQALRADGTVVDLAVAFRELITVARAALPEARLIFNNVNNFPTWATASAPQDATYVEVWPPHTRLDHLARLIRDARALAPDKPVILAAYLSVFAAAAEEEAIAAARLMMATIFSHGGTHLLAGEDGAVLTDPYYVRHHRARVATQAMLTRWYDFAVRYGDLLYDSAAVDVTTAFVGGINRDLRVNAGVPVSVDPEPGALWVRVVETHLGLVVHLIDLSTQDDLVWDAPRRPGPEMAGVRIELLRAGAREMLFTTPEGDQRLERLEPVSGGGYDVVALPPWSTWALVLVRERDAANRAGPRAGATGPDGVRSVVRPGS